MEKYFHTHNLNFLIDCSIYIHIGIIFSSWYKQLKKGVLTILDYKEINFNKQTQKPTQNSQTSVKE